LAITPQLLGEVQQTSYVAHLLDALTALYGSDSDPEADVDPGVTIVMRVE
jgi:hypothetical protein